MAFPPDHRMLLKYRRGRNVSAWRALHVAAYDLFLGRGERKTHEIGLDFCAAWGDTVYVSRRVGRRLSDGDDLTSECMK